MPPDQTPENNMDMTNGKPQTIIKWPNPTLARKSIPYDPVALMFEDFRSLVRNMVATMKQANGVGLSAIQIGTARRVFVMDTGDGPEVFVNPKIVETVGLKSLVSEGCLSLPGVFEQVPRFPGVRISFINVDTGKVETKHLNGLQAQIAQHEIEHLDGFLFVERLSPAKKDEIRTRLRTFKASGWSKTREFEPRDDSGTRNGRNDNRRPRNDRPNDPNWEQAASRA